MSSYTRMLWGIAGLWIWAANGLAVPCEWVSRVVSVQGTVEVKRAKQGGWSRIRLQDRFCPGDTVHTNIHSRAGLLLRNETLLRLDQKTTLILPQLQEEDSAWLNLLRGALHFISNIPYRLKVNTPFVNAALEGTEFAVRVSETETRVWVVEGQVLVENLHGSLPLGPGKAALAEAGKAPVPYLKIKPRDAVQWALYYPPILDYGALASADPRRKRAVTLYRTGQIPAAIEALNSIPESARDSSFFTQRAAILLSVGQVQSARSDIDRALALSPGSGVAFALQSIIALVRNDKGKALVLAEKAVTLEPQSPIPRVALSYAQQSAFDIEAARASIQKAVELAPDDPLAWARLSELELSTGNLDEALEAAQKAEALDPELSHTQMVLGFARLLQIDIDEAKESFRKAIELDPSAPLPRLGMGLARIRQGDVEEGTHEIEVAAILDPDNSLVRSYLGKAYYEEKRGNVASREFEIAKKLDPNDPTPWFYDAIQKQTTNRPVEALHDIQKSIELNDNRAVYRSRLLLDDDLAARSSSLGRIYNDLGFQKRGLLEGWNSVNRAPSNYSAHRLLADNYATLKRHEIARVSELLQSQLLQPINITPIQPRLAESNLLILDGLGPANFSFNEFNPLFTRNRLALQASGIVGTNDTYGDEIAHSGLWNQFSYSIGQFHYESNGFRANNDLTQDIYNAFAQVAVTPDFNLQSELRHNEFNSGDLRLRFDPSDFSDNERRIIRNTSLRLGARYHLSPEHNIIASFLYNKRRENFKNREETSTPPFQSTFDLDASTNSHSYNGELQSIFHFNDFFFIFGGGYFQEERADIEQLVISMSSPFLPFPTTRTDLNPTDSTTKHGNVYLYLHNYSFNNMIWTAGVSYESFNELLLSNNRSSLEENRVNPKVGLTWQIFEDTTLRAAWFKSSKRTQSRNATIEPTQIAGFNQYFDDVNGTVATRYGFGIDHIFSPNFYGGIEYTKRNFFVPTIFRTFDNNISRPTEKQKEDLHRAYLYYTPFDTLALSAEYNYEAFRRTNPTDDATPKRLSTHRVPLQIRYFLPSGFFASFTTNFVSQSIEFTINQENSGSDDFWTFDASIGYRMPKRWGIASIGVRNLFNQNFNYYEADLQTGRAIPPAFQPERIVFGQMLLAF